MIGVGILCDQVLIKTHLTIYYFMVLSNYFNSIKYSFGGGIRFQLLKNNPTLIRFDVGVGRDGNNGVYFGVNEAF